MSEQKSFELNSFDGTNLIGDAAYVQIIQDVSDSFGQSLLSSTDVSPSSLEGGDSQKEMNGSSSAAELVHTIQSNFLRGQQQQQCLPDNSVDAAAAGLLFPAPAGQHTDAALLLERQRQQQLLTAAAAAMFPNSSLLLDNCSVCGDRAIGRHYG